MNRNNKVIAIDVLLVPSTEMHNQAIKLNEAIRKNNPNTIKLNNNTIPHITLLQCYVKEKDLPKVKTALTGIFKMIENENLKVENLTYSRDKDESFAVISVEKSEAILAIHKKAIELIKPYIIENGNQEAFVQNKDGSAINQPTLDYVPKFISDYSNENFKPHISLGVAKTTYLDSLATDIFKPQIFKAVAVGLYQLGDNGTAQKFLWKSK